MKIKLSILFLLGLLFVIFIVNNCTDTKLEEHKSNWTISKRSICNIDKKSYREGYYKVSPNNKRLAYSSSVVGEIKSYVVLDGKKQKDYFLISYPSFSFSPDSQHFAYVVVNKDKKWHVIVDKKEQQDSKNTC